jgi:hypothetical protein
VKLLAILFLVVPLTACGGASSPTVNDDAGGAGNDGGAAGADSSSPSDASGTDTGAPHDAAGDAQCATSDDCKRGGPDTCNICPSPLNRLVCVSGACVCACRADAG